MDSVIGSVEVCNHLLWQVECLCLPRQLSSVVVREQLPFQILRDDGVQEVKRIGDTVLNGSHRSVGVSGAELPRKSRVVSTINMAFIGTY